MLEDLWNILMVIVKIVLVFMFAAILIGGFFRVLEFILCFGR